VINKIQWTKFGLESLLIVISILAAFSVDSWWATREQSAEVHQTLFQLREEFAANSQVLAERRERQLGIIKAAEELLAVTGSQASDSSLDVVTFNKLIFTVFDWFTYDPQSEVTSSLIQSGKLGLIESDELRYALASWPAALVDLQEDEIVVRDFSNGPLMGYLVNHAPLRDIEKSGLQARDHYPAIQESRFPFDMKTVLSDRAFENLVHHKLWLTMEVVSEYDSKGKRLAEISTLIEREIIASR
jgi:hypothetical protein